MCINSSASVLPQPNDSGMFCRIELPVGCSGSSGTSKEEGIAIELAKEGGIRCDKVSQNGLRRMTPGYTLSNVKMEASKRKLTDP